MPFICSYFECNALYFFYFIKRTVSKIVKHFILTRPLTKDNIADIVRSGVIAALSVRTYAFLIHYL